MRNFLDLKITLKISLIISVVFMISMIIPAHAQSTAPQTTVCLPTTVGCSGGASSCCIPISSTNPMPTQ